MDIENEPPLQEKDFIQESYKKNPFPFWIWVFLITTTVALIWGGEEWLRRTLNRDVAQKPFLAVTNRDISLFLWQNPVLMRANVPNKNGYLTGFQYIGKETIDLPMADTYVVAPPELLFFYHTWNRLLKADFISRPILIGEFLQFLDYVEEWQPQYWPAAPKQYVSMVNALPRSEVQDLNQLPDTILPLDVRMAFVGWQNYFREGRLINETRPTFAEMETFLIAHPHYRRNYWQNIVDSEKLHYLKTLNMGDFDPNDLIPEDEISPFLKVAFYNWKQSSR